MTLNVLVSAAGRRVALVRIFKDELRRLGLKGQVFAADASPLSAALHDADARFLVPRCDDPAFMSSVLRLCEDHAIGLVVPTIDPELPMYAEHRERFVSIGTTVAVSAADTIRIAYDKVRTHDWLVEHDFPTVRQATVGEVRRAPERWPGPLIVKPRRGSASIDVRRIPTAAVLPASADDATVVQETARGNEHTVDVFVGADGRCIAAVPRRRLEVRAGEVSKGVTVHDAAIERLASAVAERLPGAYGVLNIQMFHDPATNELRIIEINPRFGGGYPLAHHAGAPMARWLLEDVARLPSTASSLEWRAGVVMLRFDDAVFVDAEEAGWSG